MLKTKRFIPLLVLLLSLAVALTGCAGADAIDTREPEVATLAQHNETENADGKEDRPTDKVDRHACQTYEEEAEPRICSYIVDCSDAETCEAWSATMIRNMEKWFGKLTYSEEWDVEEKESKKEADLIATYQVEGNEIGLKPTNEDEEYYAWLWDRFTWVIPSAHRKMISRFEVYDHADMMAYVVQDDANEEKWIYAANQIQATYETERIMTDIHEFGHLLSLNTEQVDPHSSENGCKTHLFEEGCANNDSYIYNFYQKFWKNGNSENKNDYVSEYAMSDIYEDFAESWSYFVMSVRPTSASIADQKVLFFYKYDELIKLKTNILGRAASWMDRNTVSDTDRTRIRVKYSKALNRRKDPIYEF